MMDERVVCSRCAACNATLLGDGEGYALVGVLDSRIVQLDGLHDTPQGVFDAAELHRRLGFIRPGVTYRMLWVGEIPHANASALNEDAIDACVFMLDRARGVAP